MMRLRAWVVALAVACSIPLAATAALIVPVSQTRSVTAFADADPGDPSSSSFSAGDFGTFQKSASAHSAYPSASGWYFSNGISQTSTIGEDRLTANLTASYDHVFANGTAYTRSLFDVTFDLLEPASYTLGNGEAASFNFGVLPPHTVTLRDELGQVIAQPRADYYPFGSSSFVGWASVRSGVLAPGRYRMTAEWYQPSPGDPDSWRASALLVLTPIPEPGTALLVALGLGGLAARRTR
jgi:hypothetical protein